MHYELRASVLPADYVVSHSDREAMMRQQMGTRTPLIEGVEPDVVEEFTSLAWRRAVYSLIDPHGISTPGRSPSWRIDGLNVPEYLAESVLINRGEKVVKRYPEEQWGRRADEVAEEQAKIMEAYKSGDYRGYHVMKSIARYVGFHHATIAQGGRPADLMSPIWQPDVGIRPPLNFTGWGQVYIPDVASDIPARNKLMSMLRGHENMLPVLHHRKQPVTYIGGQLTSIPVMTYAERKGKDVKIIDTDQLGMWSAQSFRHHAPIYSTKVARDNNEALDYIEGSSSLVIAQTADSSEFDLERTLFMASQIMAPFRGHPPQVVISERAPFGLRDDCTVAKYQTMYAERMALLERYGFQINHKHISPVSSNFILVATHPGADKVSIPIPCDEDRILNYQKQFDVLATA